MNKYSDEQLVAMRSLLKTIYRLGLLKRFTLVSFEVLIDNELRMRHGIFS